MRYVATPTQCTRWIETDEDALTGCGTKEDAEQPLANSDVLFCPEGVAHRAENPGLELCCSRTHVPSGQPESLVSLLTTPNFFTAHELKPFQPSIISSDPIPIPTDRLPFRSERQTSMNRKFDSSEWKTHLDPIDHDDSESDGQQEMRSEAIFPVRRQDAPSSPTILTSTSRPDSGQQPMVRNGSSAGLAPPNKPDLRWGRSAARPSSPIDISAIEEENLPEFRDNPWTIARRLGRKTNKRKASSGHPKSGPQFFIKLPVDQPEPARDTLHSPSNSLHYRAFNGHGIHAHASPGIVGPIDEPWAEQSQLDFPYQEELMDGGPHEPPLESVTIPRSDTLSPKTLPPSSSPIQLHLRESQTRVPGRNEEGRIFKKMHHILGSSERHRTPWGLRDHDKVETRRQAASPCWPAYERFDRASLPGSHSENVSEYTGIENTTSAIDHLPGLSPSVPEGDEELEEETFDSYYKATGLEDELRVGRDIYEDEEAGFDDRSYGPAPNQFLGTEELDGDGYDNEGIDYYPSEDAQASTASNQAPWRSEQPVALAKQAWTATRGEARRGRIPVGGFPVDDRGQQEQEAVHPRGPINVGRLSRYTKRAPYRAPAYARGSSSARVPAEFQFKNPHSHPRRVLSLIMSVPNLRQAPQDSCLYEPSATRHQAQGALVGMMREINYWLQLSGREPSNLPHRSLPSHPSSLHFLRLNRVRIIVCLFPRGVCTEGLRRSEAKLKSAPMDLKEYARARRASLSSSPRDLATHNRVYRYNRKLDRVKRLHETEAKESPLDEEEGSSSESVEVIEPDHSYRERPRGKAGGSLDTNEARHHQRVEKRGGPLVTPGNHPLAHHQQHHTNTHPSSAPTHTSPRQPKTFILKYDFSTLSVGRCRAVREVLEEQVSAKRIWAAE
ncbi:hypothetical protein PSTT_02113 [Puccinia striiformis]|uniref:Uncharacterized protein n=1 Tax=Puccinia striiformis TaxID=27350 RepID=A0A2S4W1A7_9BASI|nr:hypothetical protein PSTT_02113 [Puccinia striiformis]